MSVCIFPGKKIWNYYRNGYGKLRYQKRWKVFYLQPASLILKFKVVIVEAVEIIHTFFTGSIVSEK